MDSTPSWAAPIRSARTALRRSTGIFREGGGGAGGEADVRRERGDGSLDRSASGRSREEGRAADGARAEDHDEENAAASDRADGGDAPGAAPVPRKEAQELRTEAKLRSSLSVSSSDDGSVGSAGSRGSRGGAQAARREAAAAPAPAQDRALGRTHSADEENDQDPAVMIDSINSMLSECREILDTEEAI